MCLVLCRGRGRKLTNRNRLLRWVICLTSRPMETSFKIDHSKCSVQDTFLFLLCPFLFFPLFVLFLFPLSLIFVSLVGVLLYCIYIVWVHLQLAYLTFLYMIRDLSMYDTV